MSATIKSLSRAVVFCAMMAIANLSWAIPSPVPHVHTGVTVHWKEAGSPALPWTNAVANVNDHNHLTADDKSNGAKWVINKAWDNRTLHSSFTGSSDWAHGQIFSTTAVRYGWSNDVPALAKNGVEAGFNAWVSKATTQYNAKKDPWDVLSIDFDRVNAGAKEITIDFVPDLQKDENAYADFSSSTKTIRFEPDPTMRIETSGRNDRIRLDGAGGAGGSSIKVATPWSYDGTPNKTVMKFEYSSDAGANWTDNPPGLLFGNLRFCAATCDKMVPAAHELDIFEMDFRTIADHEIGHAIGIGHTGSGSAPIMRDDIADKASFNSKMAIDTDSALAVAIDYTWSKLGAFQVPTNEPTITKAPTVESGPATVETLGGEPTVTKTDNGYKVTSLTYKVTATDTGAIFVKWDSEREFVVTDKMDVDVSIKGNTDITLNGGEAQFFVTGTLDGVEVTKYELTLITPPGEAVSWNQSGTKADVTAGNHKLDMHSGFIWFPDEVGQMITVSSLYEVSAVPEPSSLILIALGSLLLFVYKRRTK